MRVCVLDEGDVLCFFVIEGVYDFVVGWVVGVGQVFEFDVGDYVLELVVVVGLDFRSIVGFPVGCLYYCVGFEFDRFFLYGKIDGIVFACCFGFLVGVCVVRPKVYFKNLDTSFAMLMKDAYSWLPPSLASDPYASFVKVAASDPPLDANTAV